MPDSLMSTVRPLQHSRRSGINSDINVQPEPGMAPRVGRALGEAAFRLIPRFHLYSSNPLPMGCPISRAWLAFFAGKAHLSIGGIAPMLYRRGLSQ